MRKNCITCITLSMAVLILCLSGCHEKPENWTHRTFQGTVVSIWSEDEKQYFTLRRSIGGNSYAEDSFVINEDTLYSISFEVGDEVVVETDYDMSAHNGSTVPYPAVLIADPDITDTH